MTSLQSLRPCMFILGLSIKKSSSTVCLELCES